LAAFDAINRLAAPYQLVPHNESGHAWVDIERNGELVGTHLTALGAAAAVLKLWTAERAR
jgi:hypothetical protein